MDEQHTQMDSMNGKETTGGESVQRNAVAQKPGNNLVKIKKVGQEKDMEIREANKRLAMENKDLKQRLEQLLLRINALEMSPPPRRRKDANATNVEVSNMFGVLEEDETMEDDSVQENGATASSIAQNGEGSTLNAREKALAERRARFAAPIRDDLREAIKVNTNLLKAAAVAKAAAAAKEQGKPAGATKKGATAKNNGTKEQNAEGNPRTLKGRVKVYNLEAEKMTQIFNEKNIEVNFKMAKNAATMIACHPEHRLEVVPSLKEHKHTGHSYMTQEDRDEIRLLKNLHHQWEPNKVKEELVKELNQMGGSFSDIMVERFKTYHSEANDLKYNMYIVRAMDKDTINMLTGTRGVCHTIVQWEKLRKGPITQCHNCYQFGHSMKGQCFNPIQCKRCLEKGANHKCTVELVTPMVENDWNVYAEYTCCNCKEKGHPPTHKKCSSWGKAVEAAEKAKATKNRERLAKNQGYEAARNPPIMCGPREARRKHPRGRSRKGMMVITQKKRTTSTLRTK